MDLLLFSYELSCTVHLSIRFNKLCNRHENIGSAPVSGKFI